MAKQLVEFQIREGNTIYVEVDVEDQGTGLAGKGGVVTRAKQTFEESISLIRPVAETVIENLRELANTPDQVSVEFGVKLSAKAGVILASTDAEANLKISLTWKKGT